MVLGRGKIVELVKAGLIENFSIECLGGAGYDLRVDKLYSLESDSYLGVTGRQTPKVAEIKRDTYTIPANGYVLIETVEKVNMPIDLMARVSNRSTLFRCGCSLFNAVVDPGYKGTLTFGLKNLSEHEFTLERRSRIAQIVFEHVEGDTVEYKGKYQGGKVV